MEEKLKQLYVLAEMVYIDQNKELSKEELFPKDWYGYLDYKVKTEIIGEAIKNKILVVETDKYKETIEGLENYR